MLQIHGIFNLVAALYETRLLQPKNNVHMGHPASQFVHIIKPYDCIATINSQGFQKSLPL